MTKIAKNKSRLKLKNSELSHEKNFQFLYIKWLKRSVADGDVVVNLVVSDVNY